MVKVEDRSQISECIRSKGAMETESLLLKDKAGCFTSWQDKQFLVSETTCSNWSLEIKDFERPKEMYPKRECQRWKGDLVEAEVASWVEDGYGGEWVHIDVHAYYRSQ